MEIGRKLKRFYDTSEGYFTHLTERGILQFNYYISAICPNENGRFLDVGSGTGQVVHFLSKYKIKGVGVDISNLGTNMAHTQLDKKGETKMASFMVADVHRLPFKDDSFDSVGSCEVLEHLYQPEKCIGEMHRVLKPGGKLVTRCPNKLVSLDIDRMEIECFYKYLSYKNFLRLLKKYVEYKRGSVKPELKKPDLSEGITGGDADAVYMSNPFDVIHFYNSNGLLIEFLTTQGFEGRSHIKNVMRKIVNIIPILKYCGDPVFIVGYKKFKNSENPVFNEKIFEQIKKNLNKNESNA